MKRFMSILLSVSLLLTSLSFTSFAKTSKYEPTTEELEEIIKIVRTSVKVPDEQSEFTWHYNSANYYSRSSWSLYWRASENNSYTNISCYSDGTIFSYTTNSLNSSRKPVLPERSAESYTDTIISFITQIAPYTEGHLLLESAKIHSGLRNHTYAYSFVRIENGIIVPDNTVRAVLDYTTGTVTSVNINYDRGLDFTSPENAISKEKAMEIISEAQNMTLSYRLKSEYDEKGLLKTRKAYLVYTPDVPYVSVDAVSGEIYTQRDTWEIANSPTEDFDSVSGSLKNDAAAPESAGSAEYELTEQELAQLEILKNLISREDAIRLITQNEYLYLDSNATAVEANLNRNTRFGETEESFTWSIVFTKPYDEKGYYAYSRATIDAKTGKLLTYSANLPDYYYYEQNELEIPALTIDEEKALIIAQDFLKQTDPERFALTRKGTPEYEVVLDYAKNAAGEIDFDSPSYRARRFSFIRVNEGVDFSYNYLNTKVDLVTAKVFNYRTNWYDNVEFESPKNAITPKEALNAYHSCEGFGINYEINSNYTYKKYLADESQGKLIAYDELYEKSLSTRAVYSAYDMGTNIIGALSGKMITYNGEEYKKDTPLAYTDISSHWASEIINRFRYADIGFEGEKFFPDKLITPDEFSMILNSCQIYGTYGDSTSEENIGGLTRVDAVKFIISYLGYQKVAELENVFITDFADNMSLKSEDMGYVAIARGFGLVQGDGRDFRPYDMLTRSEALQICLNVLELGMLD